MENKNRFSMVNSEAEALHVARCSGNTMPSGGYHQIALNFFLSTFVLKEKLLCFNDIALLSAQDVKRWIIFNLYRQISEDDMIDQIFERHCRRQADNNNA